MTSHAAPAGTAVRRPRGPAPTSARVRPAEATAAGMLALFLAALLLPVYFDIAGLRLTPVRVVLMAAFVPLAIRWLSGAAGRITPGDVFIGLHCLWILLALFAIHGPSRIPFAGITIVEIFSSYLLGRVLIRNVADYRAFFRYLLIALAILAPFVFAEMLTGRLIVSNLLDSVAATHQKVQTGPGQQRLGFYRAQAVVDHPILWGLFCSIAIANVFYLWRERLARSLVLTGFATAMTFTSLSSGPLLAATLQIGMIGWGWVTRNAWWVLVGLIVFAYVVVDLLSNRAPVQVLITYLTFNSDSAYWRLHIWNYGSAEVWRNPLFGIGLNDWYRPSWMVSASVDNFWLLTTMRYGIPSFLLLAAGIAANLVQIMRTELPEDLKDVRTGYVIATFSTIMALSTVHIWGSTATLMMFYFGAGSWLITGTVAEGGGTPQREGVPQAPRSRTAEPAPDAAARRRAPTRAERTARRRAQYSRQRP